MDYYEFKKRTEDKVSVFDSNLLNLKDLSGHELKERIFTLLSNLYYFNELVDNTQLSLSVKESLLKEVQALAIDQLVIHNTKEEKKISITLMKELAEKQDIEIHGRQTNVAKIRHDIAYIRYALDRFQSVYNDIDKAISVGQSGLAFDRTELNQTNKE